MGPLSSWGMTRAGSKIRATYPCVVGRIVGFLGEEEEYGSDEERGQASPNIQFLPDTWGFPVSSVGQESACHAGDPGSIPGSGRSPGEGMLEKGIFKKGFLESGKETGALGAGGLLHR